jgi:hypothetical protein
MSLVALHPSHVARIRRGDVIAAAGSRFAPRDLRTTANYPRAITWVERKPMLANGSLI